MISKWMSTDRLPALPRGYTTQWAGGFRDRAGLVSYELHRVYGRPQRSAGHQSEEAEQLDPALTYWASSWATFDAAFEERPAGRWLSYEQARSQLGPSFTFAQFSSVGRMREMLSALLGPSASGATVT